jgi:carbamoylphosphate synthase large subunit
MHCSCYCYRSLCSSAATAAAKTDAVTNVTTITTADHCLLMLSQVLGTPIPSIIATEDRDVFAQKLNEIGEKMALSYCATTLDEGLAAARRIGFPVLIRAAFALGGLGSGFAENEEDFLATARKAFSSSDQVRVTSHLKLPVLALITM